MPRIAAYKLIVAGVVLLAAIGLVVFKLAASRDRDIIRKPDNARRQDNRAAKVAPTKDSVVETGDTGNVAPGTTKMVVLATVDSAQISEAYLNDYYQSLSADYQSAYKYNLEDLLEQLIIQEVLYQEAIKRGYAQTSDKSIGYEAKMGAINQLAIGISKDVTVSEQEIREFYDRNPDQVGGAAYEEIKAGIKDYLAGQKQNAAVNALIESLKKRAKITRNKDWLAKQAASKPQNPLTKALKSGRATVLDIGSGTCVPCKMMKPILAELEKEYSGRANIILLDINEYRDVANQYNVRVIPTQFFFDKQGNQAWRHEGFLAKADMVSKLKELGVE
jgi:thioredoxin 1